MDKLLPEAGLTPEETILHEVSVKLLSITDHREVLDLVAYHTAKLLQAGKTSINLVEDGRLRTCAKYVEPDGYFAFLGTKTVGANPLPEAAHPHMYETLRSGRPRIVQSHTIHDLKERVEGGPLAERPDIFYVFEPLRAREEVLGVAAINLRRDELEAITPRQRAVVQQLLSFAAIALSNAKLIDRLRESEERYRTIFEISGDLICERSLDGRLTLVNDAAVELLGVPREQILGRRLADLVHPEDRQRVREAFEELLRTGTKADYSLRVVTADGSLRHLMCNSRLVRDASGRAVSVHTSANDVTDGVRRQQETEAHALLMEAIFENSQDPLVYLDREFNFVRVNEAYALACGRSKEEFTGRNHFDLYPSEAQAIFERVRDTGEPYTAVARPFTFPDHPEWGETYWDWTLTPVKDPAGGIEGFVFSLVNVTDRIRRQQEIEEANRRLQEAFNYQGAVLGSLEEVVLSLDLEGRIIYSNPAASRTFGYSPEELRRLKICDLRIGCEEADSGCLVRQLAQTEAAIHDHEVEFRNREGYSICGRQALTPLRDPKGALIGAVLVIQDVSTVRRLEGQAAYLSDELAQLTGRHGLMVASQAMEQVMKQVSLVAPTDSSVLILGETGTGKELIARVIHDMSPRKAKPLVKVHCAALSPGLIESEFFGHERGAFTGALSRRIGRFELADGGTIFLDEVGDIPLETQVKLLRVIQEREFERVGGTRPIKVDVRIMAATNRNIEEAVDSGSFRRDLFYRLSVFPIRVPALRERPEAIPVLAAHFAQDCAKPLGKQIEGINPESLRRLQAYGWPGNVRELRNVIERAVITSPGPLITVPGLGFRPEPGEPSAASDDLEENERRHILRVLEKTSWRIEGQGGAAELLRINASTLRSRLKKLGIVKPKPSRDIPQPAASSRSARPTTGTRR